MAIDSSMVTNMFSGAGGFFLMFVMIVVPVGVLIGGILLFRWWKSFDYDVEIFHIGSKNVISDHGRIKRLKDGTTLFQLRSHRKVTMPVPKFDYILWKDSKKHVKLYRYSENDWASLSFVPCDSVTELHIDVTTGKPKDLFSITSINMRNAFVNQVKATQGKFATDFWEKYGSLISIALLVVAVIIVVYLTLGYASDQVGAITAQSQKIADGLSKAGEMCANVANTRTPPPI